MHCKVAIVVENYILLLLGSEEGGVGHGFWLSEAARLSKVVDLELAGRESSSSSSDVAGGDAWRIGGDAAVGVDLDAGAVLLAIAGILRLSRAGS